MAYDFAEDRYGDVYIARAPQPWRIIHIDHLIDDVLREVALRERVKPYSAASWQRAWDRQPKLKARRDALMRRRQNEREYFDRLAWRELQAEQRRRRTERDRQARRDWESSKCPTCGQHTLRSNAA